LGDIQNCGRSYIGASLGLNALDQIRKEVQALGGVPRQMFEMRREVHRMLTGPAADLQNLPGFREAVPEYLQNGALIPLASVRER
jgi:hypothetical protein